MLTTISAVAIPVLCRIVIEPWSEGKRHTTGELVLLLMSRFLTVIVVPIAVAVVVEEGCFSRWRAFWDVCKPGSTEFDLEGPVFSEVAVLRTKWICSPQYFSGRCPRNVISSTSLLLLQKLALESTLRPTLTVLLATTSWTRSRFRVVFERYGILWIGTSATVQALTWVEIAVVYTAVSPLVGGLAWTAIWVNFVVGRVLCGARRGGLLVRGHGAVPVWWLAVSVGAMCVLLCWCWVENRFAGWQLVIVFVTCVTAAAICLSSSVCPLAFLQRLKHYCC